MRERLQLLEATDLLEGSMIDEMRDPLDAAGSALWRWDVSFQLPTRV